MAREITHDFVRTLAKNLRERTGREIKHTEIIDDIAGALGERPDALMHSLKADKSARQAAVSRSEEPAETVESLARAAGYEIVETGGGCTAWGKILRSRKVFVHGEDDVAELEVLMTVDEGVSHLGLMDVAHWEVGLNLVHLEGAETPVYETDLTFADALAAASKMEASADHFWDAYLEEAAAAEEADVEAAEADEDISPRP